MELAALTTHVPYAQPLTAHGECSNLLQDVDGARGSQSSKTNQYTATVPGLRFKKQAKVMFGKVVPFYQLSFDHLVRPIDVPAARFPEILQRLLDTFNYDSKGHEETFALWSGRKGLPFFTELLEDINLMGPDDLPELLRIDLQASETVLS